MSDIGPERATFSGNGGRTLENRMGDIETRQGHVETRQSAQDIIIARFVTFETTVSKAVSLGKKWAWVLLVAVATSGVVNGPVGKILLSIVSAVKAQTVG